MRSPSLAKAGPSWLTACVPAMTAWALGPAGLLAADRYFWPKAFVAALAACALAVLATLPSAPDRHRWELVSLGTLALSVHLGLGLLSGALSREPWGAVAERLLPLACAGAWYAALSPSSGDPRFRRGLNVALLVAAIGVAALALGEALGMSLPWATVRRPVSTLGGRNQVAGYVGMVLPLAMARLLRRPGLLSWLATLLLTLVVLLTRARSVWLGLLLAGLVTCGWGLFAALRRGWRPRAPGLIALASALGVALLLSVGGPWPGLVWREPSPLAASLQRIVEYDQGSGRGRLEHLRMGLALTRESPLLGLGPGSWNDASALVAHEVPGRHAEAWGDDAAPRSEFVRALVETGLLGTAALLVALGLFIHARWRRWRRFALPPAEACALLVCVVHALLDLPLTRPDSSLLIASLALLAGPPRAWIRVPPAAARGVAMLTALGLGVTALRGAGYYVSVATSPVIDARVMARAVRWLPRLEVVERLSLELAREQGCTVASPVLTEALSRAPHHTGLLCLAAACARDQGDARGAQAVYEAALQVEPHLVTPLTPEGTWGRCAPRVKPSRLDAAERP